MSAFRRLTSLSAHLAQSRPLVPSQTFKLGSSYSSPAPSAQMSTEIKELVDKAVKQHKVAIFGKSWCPYCKTAKGIAERTVNDPSDMEYIDLDQISLDMSEVQGYLKSLTGQSTVPFVYIGQEFIGGCSDLQKIPKDQLKQRVSA